MGTSVKKTQGRICQAPNMPSKVLQLEGKPALHANLESADPVNLLKLSELHPKRSQETELRKIGQSVQPQRQSDVFDAVSSPLAKACSRAPVVYAKTRDKEMVVRRNGMLRKGAESGPKVPKRVTKMYRTGDARGNTPAGVVKTSATPAVQTVWQTESKPSTISSPSAELLATNQFKIVEVTKMLITVHVSGSTGPLRFLVEARDPVMRVIELALQAYLREGRLPRLGDNCKLVELYCANSNFEALDPVQLVGGLGTRRFFLHRKKTEFERVAENPEDVKAVSWKSVWSILHRIIFPNR